MNDAPGPDYASSMSDPPLGVPARASRARADGRGRPPGEIYANLDEATRHPGIWVVIATYPSPTSAKSAAWGYRTGARPTPAGEWKFASAKVPNGSRLWAMWTPPGCGG